MYKPKFVVNAENLFNPVETLGNNPPRVIANIYVSPEWEGKSPDQLQEASAAIVKQYAAQMNSLVQSSRQGYSLGSVPAQYTRRAVPGMEMRMSKNAGGEILSLDLFPNAAPSGVVPLKDKLVVPITPIIKLDVPFTYWPVPGSQSFGNPPAEWKPSISVNFFDPIYAPKNNANDPPMQAQGQPSGVGTVIQTARDEGYTWLGDSALVTGGYAEAMWLKEKVGGTAIYERPIEGKRYWEVHIKALNEGTPGPTSTPEGISDNPQGLYVRTTLYDFLDSTGYTMHWPADLDNFLNPMIGLAPAYFLNTPLGENNFTHYILGLDTDMEQPRSIYVTRTKTVNGTYQDNSFNTGYYSVENTTGADLNLRNLGIVPAGEEVFLAPLNSGYDPLPGEDPSGGITFVPVGMIRGNGNSVYRAMNISTPLDGTWYGPEEGLMFSYGGWFNSLGTGPFYWSLTSLHHPTGGGRWSLVGTVGQPYQAANNVFDGVPPTVYPGTVIHRYEHGLEDNDLIERVFGDFVYWESNPNTSQVYIPWDAEVGEHSPVLKGRGDLIKLVRDPANAPFVEPPFGLAENYVSGSAPSESGNNPNGNGVDTGTNLGALAVDDVIMIAADTESRKVWFGKNGTWYPPVGGPDGSGTEEVDWDSDILSGYTTLMDAASANNPDNPDQTVTPEYYPAMSYRLGTTTLEMHLGASCRYQPPPGFKYIATDELEIEYEKGFKNAD